MILVVVETVSDVLVAATASEPPTPVLPVKTGR
jgi:hypothetical protein